jgi:GT2 family glycosyltransferase
MSMPELSVIIPTVEPRDEVECLEYLDRDSYDDYEVCLQSEAGATVARNAGIERASADKLVFLDDDSRPREGYLARMARLLDEESVVAGRTVHPRDDIFRKHFTKHYDFGEKPRYVTRFWSCNMGIRRAVFEAVGGWDEEITWGHEEVELAERVLEAEPIYYDPELVVDHPYAESISDYLHKLYRQETQRPHLWRKQGYSRRRQWLMIARSSLNPTNYVGVPLVPSLVRGAGTVAQNLGRISGMIR